MKNARYYLFILWLVPGFLQQLNAQGISYQAVARDASGNLMASQNVNVSFLIREGAENGPVIYDESHAPMTNGYALFSLVIGEGTPTTGDFNTIDWGSGDHYLEVEINGGSVGVTKFNAVPYSKVATDMGLAHLIDVDTTGLSAGKVLKFDGTKWVMDDDNEGQSPWVTNGNNIHYNNGRVGIGTSSPGSALHLSGTGNTYDIMVDDEFPFITLNATDNNGNSGIAFTEQGSLSGYIIHRATEDAIYISGNNGSSQPHLVVASNGRIGIGTGTPSYPLHMTKDTLSINGLEIANLGSANLGLDGDIVPYGGSGLAYDIGNNTTTEHWDDVVASEFITYSDARVKNSIAGLQVGLSEILALRPVQYKYNHNIDVDDKLRFGLLAQEVENILPNIVINEDVDVNPETGEVVRKPTEYKAMNYIELIPVLVKAVQDQQEYIQHLEKRLEKLENEK